MVSEFLAGIFNTIGVSCRLQAWMLSVVWHMLFFGVAECTNCVHLFINLGTSAIIGWL